MERNSAGRRKAWSFLLTDSVQWRRKWKRGRQRGREKQIEREAGCWVEGEGASLPWLAIYLWLYSGPSCCWFKVRSLAGNQAQDCKNTHTATSHAQQRRNRTSLEQGAPSHAWTQRRRAAAVDPRSPNPCWVWTPSCVHRRTGRDGGGR